MTRSRLRLLSAALVLAAATVGMLDDWGPFVACVIWAGVLWEVRRARRSAHAADTPPE